MQKSVIFSGRFSDYFWWLSIRTQTGWVELFSDWKFLAHSHIFPLLYSWIQKVQIEHSIRAKCDTFDFWFAGQEKVKHSVKLHRFAFDHLLKSCCPQAQIAADLTGRDGVNSGGTEVQNPGCPETKGQFLKENEESWSDRTSPWAPRPRVARGGRGGGLVKGHIYEFSSIQSIKAERRCEHHTEITTLCRH